MGPRISSPESPSPSFLPIFLARQLPEYADVPGQPHSIGQLNDSYVLASGPSTSRAPLRMKISDALHVKVV